MRRIMITNDDGIEASGIIRLAKASKKYGEVWVIAPRYQKSAASHSITLHSPIEVEEFDFPVEGVHAYAVYGTPGDCVRVGTLNVMPEKPDIIFSGINFGYNAGTDVQYSATVGAAMEGAFQGIPSVAFSEGTNDGYIITDKYLDQMIQEALTWDITDLQILNINFPTCKEEEFAGILRERKVATTSVFNDSYTCETLDNGRKAYMVHGEFEHEAALGTDLRALYDNHISIGVVKNIGY